MNKFAREAESRLLNIYSSDAQKVIKDLGRLEKTDEYRYAKERQRKSGAPFNKTSCLRYAFKYNCSFKSVSRVGSCYNSDQEDPYMIQKLALPNPQFWFDTSNNCYRPSYTAVMSNRFMFNIHFKRSSAKISAAWMHIKDFLVQPRIGNSDMLMPAIMNLSYGDHLYFMYDREEGQIKIGVSHDPAARLYAVQREFKRSGMTILHVVHNGGYSLEYALHKHFSEHRVWRSLEWFRDNKDIRSYLDSVMAGDDPWETMKSQRKQWQNQCQAA